MQYSIRTKEPPKKAGIAYKVFYAKDGKLYPPMVANPNGESTPVGVWLDADIGAAAAPSKTGRAQVKAGGKGTQGGSGSLAFRPGWHIGDYPKATQFARKNPENSAVTKAGRSIIEEDGLYRIRYLLVENTQDLKSR